jgi:kynurenine formamidase
VGLLHLDEVAVGLGHRVIGTVSGKPVNRREEPPMRIVDLSHSFEDGMPGFQMKDREGNVTGFTARIRPFLTHEQSLPLYQGQASFEITEISFQTSIGTYLDSPYHRHPDGRDIGDIAITDVILPGIVVDARGGSAGEPAGPDVLPQGLDLRGKAVLLNFGWDEY